MCNATDIHRPLTVSLRQVAAWDLTNLAKPGEVKISVPALQRGLVWSPQKVELLWDSILRGFPIGCLVACKPNENQQRGDSSGVTHHLLDGQQRCNAIALGYHNPFDENPTKVRGNESDSILWLDIAPEGFKSELKSELNTQINQLRWSSTREFLTRVTTKAHPWGYKPTDDTGRLSAGDARAAIDWPENPPNYVEEVTRPTPTELFPWNSNAPVPLAWLIDAAEMHGDGESFWPHINQLLEKQQQNGKKWPQRALARLKLGFNDPALRRIQTAVNKALRTSLVILEVPDELLEPTRHEEGGNTQPDVSHIEQLFQRLNTQGERLDGEELAYSLIKAYWPQVADVVDEVAAAKRQRLPSAALVSVAVRAALTPTEQRKVSSGLGISQLRQLANPRSGTLSEGQQAQRNRIEDFLRGDKRRLASACELVDEWLVYADDHPNGLPPVLVSSIARKSRSLYALLLHHADELVKTSVSDVACWKTVLPGVATLVHWFAKPSEEPEIANRLLSGLGKDARPEQLVQVVKAIVESQLFTAPKHPDEIRLFCVFPDPGQLADFRLWTPITAPRVGFSKEELENEWSPFWWATVKNRELLLYAQRHYLDKRFPKYDPSRRDLWADHNRPWDFDHLHASAYFYNKKSGKYAEVCRQWGNCIGNLRAWPFESNRSDQHDSLEKKLVNNPKAAGQSFVVSGEIAAFSHGDKTREDPKAALALCSAIKDRYIRIYEEWYKCTGIAKLFPPTSSPASPELR